MDVMEAIRTRRSIRKFEGRPVEEKKQGPSRKPPEEIVFEEKWR